MQGQLAVQLCQLVVLRNEDLPVPAVARHEQQVGEQVPRPGRDSEIDFVRSHHVRYLLGGTLVQVKADARVALAEFLDDVGQDITRLRVRRRDGQRPFFLVKVIGGQAPDILHFLHDEPRPLYHLLTGSGNVAEALALARKQLQTQFLLEELQLFADAGLGRVQAFRGRSDVQTVVGDRQQVFELL